MATDRDQEMREMIARFRKAVFEIGAGDKSTEAHAEMIAAQTILFAALAAPPVEQQAAKAEPLPWTDVVAAILVMGKEAARRGEMFPQTSSEQREDRRAETNVIESLTFYKSGLHRLPGWPSAATAPAPTEQPAAQQARTEYSFCCYSCNHEWQAFEATSDCPAPGCGTTNGPCAQNIAEQPAAQAGAKRCQHCIDRRDGFYGSYAPPCPTHDDDGKLRATPHPTEQPSQDAGALTRAKQLVCDLYNRLGEQDPSPKELREMIEKRTGPWFVWGAARAAQAQGEKGDKRCLHG